MTSELSEKVIEEVKTFLESRERNYKYVSEIISADSDEIILCFRVEHDGTFIIRIQAVYSLGELTIKFRVKGEYDINARLNENFGLVRKINYDIFELKTYINHT
ncbi:hypothetical protein ACFOG5_09755 [Pedobacter fastidiosus]|uniref:Immunity protein 50 n=1 Tax=Pedobacter fastidiosus TaxID=2765361 RepID=A0ABR7KXY4_9SPHI|nr:hypothetical protein [Pedobacter fastidiosus]MBC6112984.1 hypothetical protein [Pedobacter fastidiosus]